MLLVALYPQVSIDYLKEMVPYICKDTLVMDCCGVKREVCRVGFALAGSTASPCGRPPHGGHPVLRLCQQQGPTCFRGRPWWSSPESGTTSCCWTG
ncbi:MAG: hypothetical protein ACLUJG_06310 [Lawsonibacter sp.]